MAGGSRLRVPAHTLRTKDGARGNRAPPGGRDAAEKELHAAGLLAPDGLAAAPTANRYSRKLNIPELPAYIAAALKTNAKAWQFFQSLSAKNRRDFVVWIRPSDLSLEIVGFSSRLNCSPPARSSD